MVPTAINIEGTTINSALAIPKYSGYKLPVMSDPKKTQNETIIIWAEVVNNRWDFNGIKYYFPSYSSTVTGNIWHLWITFVWWEKYNYIWAENNPVNQYNNMRLQEINKPLFYWRATDQYPANVSEQEIENLLGKQRSDTGGLDFEISVKETTRVMLTPNIDIADRLINGQLSTIMRINVSPRTQKPTISTLNLMIAKLEKKSY